MARQESRPDPKETALTAARCLNPHPEQVRDPGFLSSEFFDARDVVQVKYEMVRKVKADGAPVTAAAAAGRDGAVLGVALAPPLGAACAGPPPGAPLQKPLTCPPAKRGRRRTRPCP